MTQAGSKLKKSSPPRFVLGRGRFAMISAVEGISLTAAMAGRAAAFDRSAMTAAERRRAIISIYRKK